ncbi:hypothetical protein GCM10010964_18530 [Caldovatus sediminis]|uniref:DUF3486 family protein n=1 Tax=Caldovatus sediminis TaxID=2041189 RepID=A0A8J3EBZ2_9PROT|nr:phage protein Gp27 family protein [Caldovatus sediminis]GGG30892.1 hypothetical protein GCM10010964_18530 [Caldovatus sediminis]
MPRPSSISRLPPEIRAEIGRLREAGRTIDEILAHLRAMDVAVSRSALGRHVKGLAELGEKLRRSRAVAEALVRQLGEAPESRTARLNIELLHTAILDLFMKAGEGEEEGVDGEGRAALAGNPMGAMLLAKALEHLTKASRHDQEFIEKVEARAAARAKREAAAAVDAVARERGLSAEMAAAIKAGIFGVRAAPTAAARPA